jgi:hypothetical protein
MKLRSSAMPLSELETEFATYERAGRIVDVKKFRARG